MRRAQNVADPAPLPPCHNQTEILPQSEYEIVRPTASHQTAFAGSSKNVAASLLLGFGGARLEADVTQADVTAQIGSNNVIAALASPQGQATAGDLANFATGGVDLLIAETAPA